MNFNLWKNHTSCSSTSTSFSFTSSQFVSQFQSIRINREWLRQFSFNNKEWSFQHSSSQQLIDAEFEYTFIESSKKRTHCTTCDIYIESWDKSSNSYADHLRLSSKCKWLKEHHETLTLAKKHACRRCSAKFFNNIKLHNHVRDHYTKKSINNEKSSIILSVSSSILSISFVMSIAITSFVTTFTTSKISISWTEIVSRSMTPSKSSRLSRFTLKYDLFTSSSSSILLHQKSINQTTKRFFTTRFKTSYLSMQDLYIRFHEKFRSSSFSTMQQHLSFASFSEQSMRIRQKRIISYFKSAIDSNHNFESISTIKLVSNKKHANSKSRTQSTWIDHLTFAKLYIIKDRFFNLHCHCSNLSSFHDRRICMNERQHRCKIKIM